MRTAICLLLLLPAPQIGLSATTLTIDAPEGGPAPAPSTLTVQNTGDGKLNWTATSTASWLTVTPTSGRLNKSESIDLAVSVNLSGLTSGTFTGSLRISDPLASNSPQTCAVTLHVNAVARIALSPSSLTFTVALGGLNPPSQSVSVQNTGGGTLSWSAAFPTAWLAGSPSSGSLTPGASQSVALSVDATGLPAGTYSGSMSVSSSSAVNSPQSVGVTLIVSQAPLITRTPSSLTFDGPQGGASPASKSLTLSNGGGGTLTWSGSTNAAWLAVSPTSGSLTAGNNQALSVSVNTTGLTEGTYLAAVQITAAGASNSPQGIPVTLNVNALPKIGVSPGTLSFVMSIDQGSSAPAAVSVTNTGSGTLNWTVAGGAAWLGTSPSGGALGALGSQPLLMTAGAGGMAPGHYTATVQISDPAAINSPQTVAVDLTVTDSPLPLHAPAGQCGLLGLELLIPAVAGMLVRRRRVFPC